MHNDFPAEYYQLLNKKENFVLLETSRYDKENYRTFLFIDPRETLQIYAVDEVPDLFARIEQYLTQDYYLAGYFGYECGYHFEQIAETTTSSHPIAWFGVYHEPIIFNHLTGTWENSCPKVLNPSSDDNFLLHEYELSNIRLNISRQDYYRKIADIKNYILAGDTYQVNFTAKYNFDFQGSALALYETLKKKQRISYGAFINSNGKNILCFSPELFFRLKDNKIITRPMKGTVKRGRTCEEDLLLQDWLRTDEKNRAENLMIVDLLRNDLGRVAEVGSVKVRELFSVEKYQTLFQMTSTIEGKAQEGLSYYAIFKSIFPSGSVTGAPKISSMQIIHELEPHRRGIYTGAIGYFSPAKEATFNVAIRTLVIDENKGRMGIGSGIVYDSIPGDEYAECELKAQFLTAPQEEFELIETILWDNGYRLLEKHINRISQSAKYFDYPCDINSLISGLRENSQSFVKGKRYKVRLKLNRYGEASSENMAIDEDLKSNSAVIILSNLRTDSNNKFLYHKTTNRHLYNEMYQKAINNGFADIIFMNERGQITEGATSNIFIKKDNHLITPPIECGLLNGVYRQYLIETQPNAREKVLSLKDLKEAKAIYICNAIRGLREVELWDRYGDFS